MSLIVRALIIGVLASLCAGSAVAAEASLPALEGCAWRATSNPNVVPNHYLVCKTKDGAMAPVRSADGPDFTNGRLDEQSVARARAGDAAAMTQLGHFYARGPDAQRDQAASRAWYEKAAAAGDPHAMISLSVLYLHGEGVAKDQAESFKWRDAAIKATLVRDDLDAMVGIGFLYQGQGVGVRDEAETQRWFRMAADKGGAFGIFEMASQFTPTMKRDAEKSGPWIERLGTTDDPHFVTFAAGDYRRGDGVAKNPAKAIELYKRSFDLGYAAAAYYIGMMYEKGETGARDDAEAARWYQLAADKGDEDAMEHLAALYREGRGVKKSEKKAKSWTQAAAARRSELPPPLMVMIPIEPPKEKRGAS